MNERPGLVILFGSGETSPSGRKVHEWLLHQLPPPITVAVLETPAGFQPNSALVAEEVADFLRVRLQSYRARVTVVPARKRGTAFSPDDPAILAPLLRARALFLGPGSPTYAVRQLEGSLAWGYVQARHRLGAAIVLASAATIAASRHALPVYEIYKVGADLHWRAGLDLLGPYGLSLVFVPHWDNAEGGAGLDTRRCFMGQARFRELLRLLPRTSTVVGIDEHTALAIDLAVGDCRVMGRGGVTLLARGREARFAGDQTFPAAELGPLHLPEPGDGLPPQAWTAVLAAVEAEPEAPEAPSAEVSALVEAREAARARRDWPAADSLRQRILGLGWEVADTREGPRLAPARARREP